MDPEESATLLETSFGTDVQPSHQIYDRPIRHIPAECTRLEKCVSCVGCLFLLAVVAFDIRVLLIVVT